MKFNVNGINCFTFAPQVSAKVMMVIMIEWLISQLKSSSYIHYTSYGLGFGSLDCDWAVWFLLQQGLIEDPCWILRAGPLPGFQWKIVTKTQTETGGVECFWPSLKWARWWWWWWWWCLTCTWCQHGSIWPTPQVLWKMFVAPGAKNKTWPCALYALCASASQLLEMPTGKHRTAQGFCSPS